MSSSWGQGRADGATSNIMIGAEAADEDLRLTAAFSRYKTDDALCCASRMSSVRHEIVTENGKRLLKPLNVNTSSATSAGT